MIIMQGPVTHMSGRLGSCDTNEWQTGHGDIRACLTRLNAMSAQHGAVTWLTWRHI